MPKGRIAEDGFIDDHYPNLVETSSLEYAERTKFNVRDSDATLIMSQGRLTGGSELTREFARKFEKPWLHVDLGQSTIGELVSSTEDWLKTTDCEILNIAGSRASEDWEIYQKAFEFLAKLFG